MAQIDWRQALGVDFNPTNFSRGASGASPLMGSSNTANAMPLSGGYAEALNLLNNPEYKNKSAVEQDYLRTFGPARINASDQALFDIVKQQMSRESRAQAIKDQLELDKARGDQMMKYRMTNDIISNLGSGARAAFGAYSDPAILAEMAQNVGKSYTEGMRASSPLTQLGQGIPSRNYYRV